MALVPDDGDMTSRGRQSHRMSGEWVQTLSGGSYGFRSPQAIAFDGTHLWIANAGRRVPPHR